MNSREKIELFLLKTLNLQRELEKVNPSSNNQKSDVEKVADKLVAQFVAQIDTKILSDAERMSEFYQTLFALENDIRQLIQSTLEEAEPDEWWNELVPPGVKTNVERNRDREIAEGLPSRSDRLIDYTTFGELGEILKNNWDLFRGIFSNEPLDRVLRIMKRLNLARGPIAHCNVVPIEEALRLKLAMRDLYTLMG